MKLLNEELNKNNKKCNNILIEKTVYYIIQ